ncbi:MAG: sigma-70 family RNA polymerase sigma factor [Candidatus Eisenbacteria bacterium]|nr:sigma-70 family RNA polymerase sigma factor [Candidatus Eisenbacteria bacterium]
MERAAPRPVATRPEPDPADERRLVEGLIAGSHDAISGFLDRTHHPVFCMASRLTADPELRREWTHTVLLAILDDLARGRFTYQRPGSFWAWFRKRAYYGLLDQYRRRARVSARESATDERGETRDLERFPGVEDPVADTERAELLDALETCLGRLPSDDQRRALRLLLFEDMTYQDIAGAMTAPLNTVRAWIRRARLSVRKCLGATLGLARAGDADA